MKLAALLTDYLFSNKRLDLSGIGIFRINNIVQEENEITKSTQPVLTEEITFENDPLVKENPELIKFLYDRTGKMKALLAADLDSHLMLAKQFLNIGKPFLFEGIGSLSKLSSGEYEFVSETLKDPASKEITNTSSSEESFTGYRSIFSPVRAKAIWKNPILIVFLLSGVAAAIWLGYLVYRNSTSDKSVITREIKKNTIPVIEKPVQLKDSIYNIPIAQKTGEHKYVLEIANKSRAFERYGRLKSYGWDVQIETADSVEYKLFLTLHVPTEETSWVIDSLTALNGRKVFVEN